MNGILNCANGDRPPFERYFAWARALTSVLVAVGFFAHTMTARAAPPYGATQCAASRIGSDLGCTANDVSINTITVAGDFLPSCVGGQTLPLDLDVTVQFQSPTRYNIGVFVSSDGKSPQLQPASGGAAKCSVVTLPTSSPFLSLDGGSCGDGNGAINGGTGAGTFRMYGADVKCITDGSGNAALNIPYLVSWDQNSNANACSNNTYPAPGTTSKCNTGTVLFPAGTSIVVLPKLTITDGETSVATGQTVTYTIVLENTTGSLLANVGFRDPLPANFSFTNVTCAASGGVTCPSINTGTLVSGVTVNSMPVNSMLTFTVAGTVGSATCGTLSNTAYATVGGQTVAATDSDAVGAACPPAAAKSFSPSTILPNGTTTLELTLTNPTSSALTNVSFNDSYPSGLKNASTPVVTNSCGGTATATANGTSLALSGGTVPANNTCRVTSIVTAAASGIYLNNSGVIATTPTNIAAVSGTLTVGGVDHIRIDHDGMGGVCNGDTVTLKACADAACSTLYTGGGTGVSLTPANTWTANPVTIGSSGIATVAYQTDLKGSVRYAISSHSFDCDNTSNGPSADGTTECDAEFTNNEFVISSADPLGNIAVAGRPHQMKVEAYKQEGAQCGVATNYKNSKTLRAWYSDAAGLTPSPLPTLSTSSGCASPFPGGGLPGTDPGANNVTLDFVNGVVDPLYLCTGDVGKFFLSLKDTSPLVVTAVSPTLTVRPFALVVSGTQQGAVNNPATNSPSGTVFAKAGTAFQTTVGAYRWNSAADNNVAGGDGEPDASATLAQITANGATPSYTWATALTAGIPYTPATALDTPLGIGATGVFGSTALSGACPTASPNCFSSGIATPTGLSYSEVGSFTLSAAATDFLGTSGVNLTALVFDNSSPPLRSGVVGRFIPDHFDTAAIGPMACAGLSPALSCPPGGLVYSGQPFVANVTAKNALCPAGPASCGTTANYFDVGAAAANNFAKAVTLSAVASAGGAVIASPAPGGALSAATLASSAFQNGATLAPGTPGAPVFTFTSLQTTSPTDVFVRATETASDGVTSLNPVAADSIEDGVKVVRGRVRVDNAFGSDKLDLPLPAQAQFWNGAYWQSNTRDLGSSSLASLAINVSGSSPVTASALVGYNPPGPWATSAALPGRFGLVLRASGREAVDLLFAVDPWMTYPWSGCTGPGAPPACLAADLKNPQAKASFGLYSGSNRFIYRREVRGGP